MSKEWCFYVNQSGSFVMPLKDFGNMMSISNNEQWTAGYSVLPGLNGCHGSSLCWGFLFFSSFCRLSELAFLKSFLTLSPRVSRLLSRTLPVNGLTQFYYFNRLVTVA
jgi:hypothetical protein